MHVLLGRNMTRKWSGTSASATLEGYSHHLQDQEKRLDPAGEFESQAAPAALAGLNRPRMGKHLGLLTY